MKISESKAACPPKCVKKREREMKKWRFYLLFYNTTCEVDEILIQIISGNSYLKGLENGKWLALTASYPLAKHSTNPIMPI